MIEHFIRSMLRYLTFTQQVQGKLLNKAYNLMLGL